MIAALVLVAYFGAMIAVGRIAERRARSNSAADYYLASRGLGPIALFFALFGTNCSPFVLIGIPGQSYHDGIGIFSLNAPIIALGIPLTFWLIGVPARKMSANLGAISPAELIAKRLDSRAVGWLLFLAFTVFTLPYMVTGVQGCAVALHHEFPDHISPRAGALLVLTIALTYTLLGGMRATAWTNVIQGALFLVIVLLALIAMMNALGGPAAAFARLAAERPDLAVVDFAKPRFEPRAFVSFSLVLTITVVCFPHMLVRLMAAGGGSALRAGCRIYPIALVALWLPAVLLGVFGALEFPGLEGRASDSTFSRMVESHFPPGWSVLGTLAVLAAAMSTLDAQLLTLGSMLSRDAMSATTERSPRAERWFLFAVGALVFGAYEYVDRCGISIFDLGQIAFSGYVMLFPTILLTVTWRRFTALGAITSIVSGVSVLIPMTSGAMPTFGFLPVLPAFVVASIVAIAASLLTSPPPRETIATAFGDALGR